MDIFAADVMGLSFCVLHLPQIHTVAILKLNDELGAGISLRQESCSFFCYAVNMLKVFLDFWQVTSITCSGFEIQTLK